MFLDETADHLFAFLRLERADRIDQRPARLQPARRAVEEARLETGIVGDDLRASAVEDLGMAAEGARCRAGGVEKDGVKGSARVPLQRVRPDELGGEIRSVEVFPQSPETTFG